MAQAYRVSNMMCPESAHRASIKASSLQKPETELTHLPLPPKQSFTQVSSVNPLNVPVASSRVLTQP